MLPNPDNYASWQDFARALNLALSEQGVDELEGTVRYIGSVADGPAKSITMPAGYSMVWLSQAEAELFLGNPEFDPPKAADLFRIDTKKLADAAVEVQKIKDGAVSFSKIFDGAVGESKLASLVVSDAKIKDLAVLTAKIYDAAIVTSKIGDAAIVSALIGEAQVLSAKISDLAVNTAKMANLAVTSAKIANLSIGSAHIIDGQIINAKIGNVIQSYGWDGVNGWRIDKNGNIEGRSIVIRNADGSVAFGSGVSLALGGPNLSGFGLLAGKNYVKLGGSGPDTGALLNEAGFTLFNTDLVTSLGIAKGFQGSRALAYRDYVQLGGGNGVDTGPLLNQNGIVLSDADVVTSQGTASDFLGRGNLARQNAIDLATQIYGSLPNFSYISGTLDRSRTLGFGSLAAIDQLNSGNISTYIAGAAIARALIANAAIGTANIDNAAITSALIADAAILRAKIADGAIGSAQIGNAVINSAHIASLNADLITAGVIKATLLEANAIDWSKLDRSSLTSSAQVSHQPAFGSYPGQYGQVEQVPNTFGYLQLRPSGTITVEVTLGVRVYGDSYGISGTTQTEPVFDSALGISIGYPYVGSDYIGIPLPYYSSGTETATYYSRLRFDIDCAATQGGGASFVLAITKGGTNESYYEPENGITYKRRSVNVEVSEVLLKFRWKFI